MIIAALDHSLRVSRCQNVFLQGIRVAIDFWTLVILRLFFFKLQFKLSFVNCRWNLLTLSDHTGLCEVFKKSNPVMMLMVTIRIAVVGVNCLSTWPPFSFVPGNPPHLFWEPLSSPTTLSGPSEIDQLFWGSRHGQEWCSGIRNGGILMPC